LPADIWADTTTPHGRLLITVIGGIAEFERSLILQRCNKGPKARADDIVFGRKPKLTTHRRREALKRLDAGETTRDVALSFNVSHTMIARQADLPLSPDQRAPRGFSRRA